jgi:hypothetical protein
MSNPIEIQEFKRLEKGALIASFDVKIESWHVVFKNCKLFGNKKEGKVNYWISMPSREYNNSEGKKCYAPYIQWIGDYSRRFQERVIDAFQQAKLDISLVSESPKQDNDTFDDVPF